VRATPTRLGEHQLAVGTDVSRLVRAVRERMGLSQEKLAVRLGVAFASVNRWENGKTKPSPLALRQIADLLVDLGDHGLDLYQAFFIGRRT
jgi:putative transcriptional regulator